MNNKVDISDYVLKILKWQGINDKIRLESNPDYWCASPTTRLFLGEKFYSLVHLIRYTKTFGLPDFSQTHSGGAIEYEGENYHWEIRYYIPNAVILDPLLLPDDNYTTSGWLELLGDCDAEIDPPPIPF